ncbi:MAG: hypothetical protein R2706_14940 [Acidimicrobiales bacterium]
MHDGGRRSAPSAHPGAGDGGPDLAWRHFLRGLVPVADLPTPEYAASRSQRRWRSVAASLGSWLASWPDSLPVLGPNGERRVQRSASDAVQVVADELILSPMRTELERRNELQHLLSIASG